MTAAALTVQHQIAAPSIEVLPAELVERFQALTARAASIQITTPEAFTEANGVLVAIHEAGKEIEARRMRMKKPLTELGRLIDQMVAKASEPVDEAKRKLQGRVHAWHRQEQEKAEAARREAQARADAERAAQEEVRRRQQAEAEAKAKADADELAAVLGTPVAAAKVELPPAPKPAPVVAAPAPVVPKAATAVRRVQVLKITDPLVVPAYLGNEELRPIDRAAVMRALKAGAVIPGAALVDEEQIVMGRA